jgi:hypothetical protein
MREKTDAGQELKQCVCELTKSRALLAASQRRVVDLQRQMDQIERQHTQELDALHKAQLSMKEANRRER